MWTYRRRPDPNVTAATADAAVLVALLGEAAYDHARQQVVAEIRGETDAMWPAGHWRRVRQAIQGQLAIQEPARD